jgi:hypothetical protein
VLLVSSLAAQPATARQDPIFRAASEAHSRRFRINGIDLNNYVEVGAASLLGRTTPESNSVHPTDPLAARTSAAQLYRRFTHSWLVVTRLQVEDALIDEQMAAEGFPPPPDRDEWTEHLISERKATGWVIPLHHDFQQWPTAGQC